MGHFQHLRGREVVLVVDKEGYRMGRFAAAVASIPLKGCGSQHPRQQAWSALEIQ